MQLRLFNDAGVKILVNVNGENFMIKNNRFLVVPCPDNQPVTLKLMMKQKSLLIPPVDIMFDLEAVLLLHVNTTYLLYLQGGKEHQLSIKRDDFSPDRYIEYIRLYIDDPTLQNNCTYEISNLKKMKRRAKFWNCYTLLLVLGIGLTWLFLSENSFWLIIGLGAIIWGIIGKIKVYRKIKRVSSIQFVQDCFNGYVEENNKV